MNDVNRLRILQDVIDHRKFFTESRPDDSFPKFRRMAVIFLGDTINTV